jgi:hypothetical protein
MTAINTYRKVWYWSYCSKGVRPCKKQSHYRPGQALRVPAGWGSQIWRQSEHESGKVVSPTHRPPLPPRKYCWYSFLLRGWVSPRVIVWPEVLSMQKSNDTMWNQTRDLPACSAVPQSTAPPQTGPCTVYLCVSCRRVLCRDLMLLGQKLCY